MNACIYKTEGITVLYEYIENIKGVEFDIHFNAGAANDPIGKAGVAHFCEHALMGWSTKRYGRKERHDKRVEYQYTNAYTSTRDMCLKLMATKDEIAGLVDLMCEGLNDLKYTQKEFDEEYKIVKDEILTRRKTNAGLLGLIYNKKHSKDRHITNMEYSLAGSVETLDKITLKDIKKFIKEYIHKENATISVAGNITKEEVNEIVSKYVSPRLRENGKIGFGRMDDKGDKGPMFFYSKPYEEGKAQIYLEYEIETKERLPYYYRENSEINNLTGKVFDELLFQHFRVKKQLCYSCAASIFQSIDKTIAGINIVCQEDNINEVIKEIPEFLKELLNGYTQELYEKCKKKLVNSLNFNVKSIQDCVYGNFYSFDRFGDILGDNEIEYYNKLDNSITFDDIKSKIENIKNKKPTIVIISKDDKENFDYKGYCKKILIK